MSGTTPEHRVACHQAAVALRRAGKPIWTYKVDIASIVSSVDVEPADDQLATLSLQLAAKLKAGLPAQWLDPHNDQFDGQLAELVEFFDGNTVDCIASDRELGHCPTTVFNDWLEQLWTWADHKRVWLRG